MSKVIVEQPLMMMRAIDNEDGTYTVESSVLKGQKLSFTADDELGAKAIYSAVEAKYIEALKVIQETIVSQYEEANNPLETVPAVAEE